MEYSTIRTQLHFRQGAYLFWKSSQGPMIPGLLNGYAVTVFNTPMELVDCVTRHEYSSIWKDRTWKVGTAEITALRLQKMFGTKMKFTNNADIWDRYTIPCVERLSKYAGDTRTLEAGQCSYMRDIVIPTYMRNSGLAVLMIPLVLAFQGKASILEEELSHMVTTAGGTVYNHKVVQAAKQRSANTIVKLALSDKAPDRLLQLPQHLQSLNPATYELFS